jgi:hypothetical protein
MAIADDGKHLSFSRTGVVTEGPFKSSTDISSTLTNADLLTDGFTTAGGERVDVEQIDAATIALLVPGLSGVLTLTAPDIDNMIQVLGYLRTSMSPGISRDWPPSTRILAAADPLWRVEPSPHQSAPGALVSFRHPSFGWVNYLIPPQELNGLSSWLGTFAAKSNADGK